ncbi:hypothetical protein ACRRS0_08105 [Agarivorans sp. QJM3NY_29]|uniref:hypothetical protein n=1 Tax=unclassified Agarivorans TaxID=2636026 RepID=UPI003D7E53BC
MRKFIIFAPSYNETVGGAIVLHKLCHVINKLGFKAYLFPSFDSELTNKYHFLKPTKQIFNSLFHKRDRKFRVNPSFLTPIYTGQLSALNDDYVVVYPETVLGNPLQAKNIVRWLLHEPGYHTGQFCFGRNELIYKFSSGIKDFIVDSSLTSSLLLKVIHYPLEHYNTESTAKVRSGTAYCLRKGANKAMMHDLNDSILIDNKSNAEIAAIFKSVKSFISYDTLTAYSVFAVLCGCQSIIIPDQGVSEEQWYPKAEDRYGLAYGFNNIHKAEETAHLVLPRVLNEERGVEKLVSQFLLETQNFFA